MSRGCGLPAVRKSSAALTVIARPSDGYAVRFVAGRRVGTAVRRNALKRRIRQAWRKRFVTGDFTFVLKPPVGRMLEGDLFALLDEIAGAIPWQSSS